MDFFFKVFYSKLFARHGCCCCCILMDFSEVFLFSFRHPSFRMSALHSGVICSAYGKCGGEILATEINLCMTEIKT